MSRRGPGTRVAPTAWRAIRLLAPITLALAAACDRHPSVTVYVSADEDVARPVIERFERNTGIRVDAKFDSEADCIVPQDFARPTLHHLRPDIERGEQGIERRRRGVLKETFVEPSMLNTPALIANMPVTNVDLGRLRKAGKLFVCRLCRQNTRTVLVQVPQPHGEAPAI